MPDSNSSRSFSYTWNGWSFKQLFDLAKANGDYIAGGYSFVDEPGYDIEFKKMMTYINNGDKIYVPSISAFQYGTLDDFKAILKDLDKKDIKIVSLNEENYDYTAYITAIDIVYDGMLTRFEEEAENRKAELRREILALEKRKDDLIHRGGRPKKEIQAIQAVALYNSGRFFIDEVCELTKLSRSTIFRALADAESEKEELDKN